jgi:superfamily II DNA or RNA helicase/diadenosine tetraphosphate (Ap4A) HIT family hydrolase
MTCPFCNLDDGRIFYEDDLIYCAWDLFPVSPAHALVITKRHVNDWFDATPLEHNALTQGINIARNAILEDHEPDGFNIGTNVGEASGQTIDHLHVHVIPRYVGDVPDPRGGVRHVIPERANYLAPIGVRDHSTSYAANRSVSGVEDYPFLEALKLDLENATRFDLAVAFITEAGLNELRPYLEDLLYRRGTLRMLTGDYLDVTEPRALHQILDWTEEYPDYVQARVFVTNPLGFHPKAYVIHRDHHSTAYIGSSNLTKHALLSGIEWNQRFSADQSDTTLRQIKLEFEELFRHKNTIELDDLWIQAYSKRRPKIAPPRLEQGIDPEAEPPTDPVEPHPIQLEALEALDETRRLGNRAGLVVLATGLGKTWLSAFDSAGFDRVLFVAHREEILNQALSTFRRIRPNASLGRYGGGERDRDADVVFASVQTLGRKTHLRQFGKQSFDYIVIDEFHHASASTYRRVIDHFEPKFLLGLTATPERSDGGDLLALCGENLVFRCDLVAGINRELLSPFRYIGVPDEVDFSNIPWRSGRFDPGTLEHAVATDRRADNAHEQWRKHSNQRTLAFCVSKRHADFMASYFSAKGVRCVAVHSGQTSAPRTQSLKELEAGQLDVVFAVDMFNEGVDVPTIDTVLMLRPTESKILWLQQFGRGLRLADEKSHLSVIDYIGNHRSFLQVPMLLFANANTPGEVRSALLALEAGTLELPLGCSVEYELEALDILKQLAQPSAVTDQIAYWYQSFREIHDRRPTASEAYHEGYDPKGLKRAYGSWFGFVGSQDDLDADQQKAFDQNRQFYERLESTPMSKSYKMVTLLAMITAEGFPGSIAIDELVQGVTRLARRVSALNEDFGGAADDPRKMKELLESNPITAWIGGRGTGGNSYFAYADGTFRSLIDWDESTTESHQELTREICDWRLAQYLDRSDSRARAAHVICKVSHSSGNPILFFSPDRESNPGIPEGWIPVEVDGRMLEANFVKIAVNVMREPGGDENLLPGILRRYFGENAGQPGTNQFVRFSLRGDDYRLEPQTDAEPVANIGQDYKREDIPGIWNLPFSTGSWNQGYVGKDGHIFLLVSLDKAGMADEHQYGDVFLKQDSFQWVSQNQMKRDSKRGRLMRDHVAEGYEVHLFVRKDRKTPAGTAAPFTYCGDLEFVDWEGDNPITVRWSLKNPLTESMLERFSS